MLDILQILKVALKLTEVKEVFTYTHWKKGSLQILPLILKKRFSIHALVISAPSDLKNTIPKNARSLILEAVEVNLQVQNLVAYTLLAISSVVIRVGYF